MKFFRGALLILLLSACRQSSYADSHYYGDLAGRFFTGVPDGDGGVESGPNENFYLHLEGKAAEVLYSQIPGEGTKTDYVDGIVYLLKSSGPIYCEHYIANKTGYMCRVGINVKDQTFVEVPGH